MAREFLVRAAGQADAGVIAALHERAFADAWDAASFGIFLASRSCLCLLAHAPDLPAPAGFVLCRMAADEADILTVAVAPEQRRRGCGRALMRALLREIAARGVRRLSLEVGAGNAAALALYTAFGFEAVGARKGYYGDREPGASPDAVVMARELAVAD
jgi:ribosomal-protein-alanine N-acetyltransferase